MSERDLMARVDLLPTKSTVSVRVIVEDVAAAAEAAAVVSSRGAVRVWWRGALDSGVFDRVEMLIS